jgi:hypothetical protein
MSRLLQLEHLADDAPHMTMPFFFACLHVGKLAFKAGNDDARKQQALPVAGV